LKVSELKGNIAKIIFSQMEKKKNEKYLEESFVSFLTKIIKEVLP